MKDSFPPHFQARKEEFLGNSAGRGGWGKAFSFSARRVISARLSGRTFVCNLAWSRAGSGEGSLHAAPRGAGGVHEDPHPEQPSCPPLHLDPPYYTVLPTSSSRSVAAQPPITSHCCVQPAEFLPTPSHGPHHCWDMPVGHPSNGAGRTPHTPALLSLESTSFLTHPHPLLPMDSIRTPDFSVPHPKPTHGPFGQPGGLLFLPAAESAVQYQRQRCGHLCYAMLCHAVSSITIPPLPNTQPLPAEPHITFQLLLHLAQVSCAPPQAPPPHLQPGAGHTKTPHLRAHRAARLGFLPSEPSQLNEQCWLDTVKNP